MRGARSAVVDTDGSGTIDAEEFRAALAARFMSPASIEKLFAEVRRYTLCVAVGVGVSECKVNV